MNSENVVLITGSSRGLGASMTEHLLKLGYTVIGVSRSPIPNEHPQYHHYCADISLERNIEELFKWIKLKFKKLDVLINNAGMASMNAFALTPMSTVTKLMNLNFNATFLCSQRAISLLRRSSHPRIVNMSTVAVPLNLEGESIYAASKSAVESLTKIMAKELSTFSITCNAIGPSPIATDLIKGVGQEKIDKLVKRQSIQKMATPEDVTNILDFYLSPNSDMISGQVLYLGGIS